MLVYLTKHEVVNENLNTAPITYYYVVFWNHKGLFRSKSHQYTQSLPVSNGVKS